MYEDARGEQHAVHVAVHGVYEQTFHTSYFALIHTYFTPHTQHFTLHNSHFILCV